MANYSTGILAAIAFFLSCASIAFFSLTDQELFDKHKHWVRPMLFLAGIAWFALTMISLGSIKSGM